MISSFRDDYGNTASYDPISIIEFQGSINKGGQSQGHYICDLQDQRSKYWFRTNDNRDPIKINKDEVTKNTYVVLMKRSDLLNS